jgi:hypothetical protein
MEIKELETINEEKLVNFMYRVRDKHQELFKDVTLMSQITKFSEEYNEMLDALKLVDNPDAFYEELADMFIVACGILRFNEALGQCLCKSVADEFVYRVDESGNDYSSVLATKVIEKMNKNIKRVWSKTKDGNYKHVSSYN